MSRHLARGSRSVAILVLGAVGCLLGAAPAGALERDPRIDALEVQRTDPAAVRHSRLLWALCFATAPLGIFALGLAARVRRFGAAVAISLVASIAYILAMFSLDEALRDGVLRTIAAWLPNILFMLAGALMLGYRRDDCRDGVHTRA